jgi:hypothetical protein
MRQLAALAILSLFVARNARADEACPERGAVWRAVTELASREHPTTFTLQAAQSSLLIEDLGSRYRVTVRDRTREYEDPQRDCEGRAHVAAVFVALVLSPNDAPTEVPPPEKVEAKPEPAREQPTTVPRHEKSRWSVEGAGMLAMAAHDGTTVLAPAAGLGVAWMSNRWGAALGARVPLAGSSFPMGPATAQLARYPIHLGARWRWSASPFAGSLEAGGVAAVLRMGEQGVSSRVTRLEGGLRLAALGSLETGGLSPYLGVFSEWIPWPYPLALTPDGPLTHVPSIWLGAVAGLSLTLD